MVGIPVKQLYDKDNTAIQPNSPDKVGFMTKSSGTQLTWGTSHTITEDGWILCYMGGKNDDTIAELKINNRPVSALYTQNSNNVRVKYMVPVKNGDTVIATGGSATDQSLWFFPNRTNLENGS